MTAGSRLLFTLALLSLTAQSERGVARAETAAASVEVVVVDMRSFERIADARVVVLGEQGCIVAEARTDRLGVARFPAPLAHEHAQYVLVDADWYFVAGRKWRPGQLEYMMPLSVLTPSGISG